MEPFDILHLEYLMRPSSIGAPPGNGPVGATHQVTPAPANLERPQHEPSLTFACLSLSSFDYLNAPQGSESDKKLVRLVETAMQHDLLQLSRAPKYQQARTTDTVEYGTGQNNNALVVKAKLNSQSRYDIVAVGLFSASGEPVAMRFPQPREPAGIARSPPTSPSTLQNRLELQRPTGQPNIAAAASGAPQARAPRRSEGRLLATDDVIKAHLWDPDTKKLRTQQKVIDAMHDAGFMANEKRVGELARESGGVQKRTQATDEDIKAHLWDPDTKKLRTRLKVLDALHDQNLGANKNRITTQQQAIMGVRNRPPATLAQIEAELKDSRGAWRTGPKVIEALNAAGRGATLVRIKSVQRGVIEQQQLAVPGSQTGEV